MACVIPRNEESAMTEILSMLKQSGNAISIYDILQAYDSFIEKSGIGFEDPFAFELYEIIIHASRKAQHDSELLNLLQDAQSVKSSKAKSAKSSNQRQLRIEFESDEEEKNEDNNVKRNKNNQNKKQGDIQSPLNLSQNDRKNNENKEEKALGSYSLLQSGSLDHLKNPFSDSALNAALEQQAAKNRTNQKYSLRKSSYSPVGSTRASPMNKSFNSPLQHSTSQSILLSGNNHNQQFKNQQEQQQQLLQSQQSPSVAISQGKKKQKNNNPDQQITPKNQLSRSSSGNFQQKVRFNTQNPDEYVNLQSPEENDLASARFNQIEDREENTKRAAPRRLSDNNVMYQSLGESEQTRLMQQRNLNEAFEEQSEQDAGNVNNRYRSSTSPVFSQKIMKSTKPNQVKLQFDDKNTDEDDQEIQTEEQIMFQKMHEDLADRFQRKQIIQRHFQSWKQHVKSWKAAISGIDKEQEVESYVTFQLQRKYFDAWNSYSQDQSEWKEKKLEFVLKRRVTLMRKCFNNLKQEVETGKTEKYSYYAAKYKSEAELKLKYFQMFAAFARTNRIKRIKLERTQQNLAKELKQKVFGCLLNLKQEKQLKTNLKQQLNAKSVLLSKRISFDRFTSNLSSLIAFKKKRDILNKAIEIQVKQSGLIRMLHHHRQFKHSQNQLSLAQHYATRQLASKTLHALHINRQISKEQLLQAEYHRINSMQKSILASWQKRVEQVRMRESQLASKGQVVYLLYLISTNILNASDYQLSQLNNIQFDALKQQALLLSPRPNTQIYYQQDTSKQQDKQQFQLQQQYSRSTQPTATALLSNQNNNHLQNPHINQSVFDSVRSFSPAPMLISEPQQMQQQKQQNNNDGLQKQQLLSQQDMLSQEEQHTFASERIDEAAIDEAIAVQLHDSRIMFTFPSVCTLFYSHQTSQRKLFAGHLVLNRHMLFRGFRNWLNLVKERKAFRKKIIDKELSKCFMAMQTFANVSQCHRFIVGKSLAKIQKKDKAKVFNVLLERSQKRRKCRENYELLHTEKRKSVLALYFHKMLREYGQMLGFKESFVAAASFHNKSLKSKTLKSMAFFLQRGKKLRKAIQEKQTKQKIDKLKAICKFWSNYAIRKSRQNAISQGVVKAREMTILSAAFNYLQSFSIKHARKRMTKATLKNYLKIKYLTRPFNNLKQYCSENKITRLLTTKIRESYIHQTKLKYFQKLKKYQEYRSSKVLLQVRGTEKVEKVFKKKHFKAWYKLAVRNQSFRYLIELVRKLQLRRIFVLTKLQRQRDYQKHKIIKEDHLMFLKLTIFNALHKYLKKKQYERKSAEYIACKDQLTKARTAMNQWKKLFAFEKNVTFIYAKAMISIKNELLLKTFSTLKRRWIVRSKSRLHEVQKVVAMEKRILQGWNGFAQKRLQSYYNMKKIAEERRKKIKNNFFGIWFEKVLQKQKEDDATRVLMKYRKHKTLLQWADAQDKGNEGKDKEEGDVKQINFNALHVRSQPIKIHDFAGFRHQENHESSVQRGSKVQQRNLRQFFFNLVKADQKIILGKAFKGLIGFLEAVKVANRKTELIAEAKNTHMTSNIMNIWRQQSNNRMRKYSKTTQLISVFQNYQKRIGFEGIKGQEQLFVEMLKKSRIAIEHRQRVLKLSSLKKLAKYCVTKKRIDGLNVELAQQIRESQIKRAILRLKENAVINKKKQQLKDIAVQHRFIYLLNKSWKQLRNYMIVKKNLRSLSNRLGGYLLKQQKRRVISTIQTHHRQCVKQSNAALVSAQFHKNNISIRGFVSLKRNWLKKTEQKEQNQLADIHRSRRMMAYVFEAMRIQTNNQVESRQNQLDILREYQQLKNESVLNGVFIAWKHYTSQSRESNNQARLKIQKSVQQKILIAWRMLSKIGKKNTAKTQIIVSKKIKVARRLIFKQWRLLAKLKHAVQMVFVYHAKMLLKQNIVQWKKNSKIINKSRQQLVNQRSNSIVDNKNTTSVVVNVPPVVVAIDNRKRNSNMNVADVNDDIIRDDLKVKQSKLIERLIILRRFCAGQQLFSNLKGMLQVRRQTARQSSPLEILSKSSPGVALKIKQKKLQTKAEQALRVLQSAVKQSQYKLLKYALLAITQKARGYELTEESAVEYDHNRLLRKVIQHWKARIQQKRQAINVILSVLDDHTTNLIKSTFRQMQVRCIKVRAADVVGRIIDKRLKAYFSRRLFEMYKSMKSKTAVLKHLLENYQIKVNTQRAIQFFEILKKFKAESDNANRKCMEFLFTRRLKQIYQVDMRVKQQCLSKWYHLFNERQQIYQMQYQQQMQLQQQQQQQYQVQQQQKQLLLQEQQLLLEGQQLHRQIQGQNQQLLYSLPQQFQDQSRQHQGQVHQQEQEFQDDNNNSNNEYQQYYEDQNQEHSNEPQEFHEQQEFQQINNYAKFLEQQRAFHGQDNIQNNMHDNTNNNEDGNDYGQGYGYDENGSDQNNDPSNGIQEKDQNQHSQHQQFINQNERFEQQSKDKLNNQLYKGNNQLQEQLMSQEYPQYQHIQQQHQNNQQHNMLDDEDINSQVDSQQLESSQAVYEPEDHLERKDDNDDDEDGNNNNNNDQSNQNSMNQAVSEDGHQDNIFMEHKQQQDGNSSQNHDEQDEEEENQESLQQGRQNFADDQLLIHHEEVESFEDKNASNQFGYLQDNENQEENEPELKEKRISSKEQSLKEQQQQQRQQQYQQQQLLQAHQQQDIVVFPPRQFPQQLQLQQQPQVQIKAPHSEVDDEDIYGAQVEQVAEFDQDEFDSYHDSSEDQKRFESSEELKQQLENIEAQKGNQNPSNTVISSTKRQKSQEQVQNNQERQISDHNLSSSSSSTSFISSQMANQKFAEKQQNTLQATFNVWRQIVINKKIIEEEENDRVLSARNALNQSASRRLLQAWRTSSLASQSHLAMSQQQAHSYLYACFTSWKMFAKYSKLRNKYISDADEERNSSNSARMMGLSSGKIDKLFKRTVRSSSLEGTSQNQLTSSPNKNEEMTNSSLLFFSGRLRISDTLNMDKNAPH